MPNFDKLVAEYPDVFAETDDNKSMGVGIPPDFVPFCHNIAAFIRRERDWQEAIRMQQARNNPHFMHYPKPPEAITFEVEQAKKKFANFCFYFKSNSEKISAHVDTCVELYNHGFRKP